jgi:hypothetical protein
MLEAVEGEQGRSERALLLAQHIVGNTALVGSLPTP